MSGRDDYYQPPPGPHQTFQSNNPYQQSEAEQNAWQSQPSTSPHGQQQQPYGHSEHSSYAPPPGPPPQSNDWQDAPPGHQPHYEPQQQQQQHSQYPLSGGAQPQQPPQTRSEYAPGLPDRQQQQLRRSAEFEESDFVPTEERGEQREALEQFEMSKGSESAEDRDIATLQREFPEVDGSLVAALYGDAGSLGGTREVLRELGGGAT
ncbi:hypothetical protein B0A55_11939 [Friedmanniomyces simplex]|uniref:Uncharacterized protein n=1 Tax=Friedmanniomyces simplex TaxID=329884 RepID=A0A4U0WL94_9PEZI|nr:hypothetical protein B0A55_11939 [Friedmanniomyces simplex]